MSGDYSREQPGMKHRALTGTIAVVFVLALPLVGIHAWEAWTFPDYLRQHFGWDVIFAFTWCGLLACVARWRVLFAASLPVMLVAYLAPLFLVVSEGVSYFLQGHTFNARFFAHLSIHNVTTGLHAFPEMIGGGLALVVGASALCLLLLAWVQRRGHESGATVKSGKAIALLAALLTVAVSADSAPRRAISYLVQVDQSAQLVDTKGGHLVAQLLDLYPIPKRRLVAKPGKNIVWIYLESLENIYWDTKVFPGLTPNLDRLRKLGLDFSGFQSFYGTTYTMAGMFSSQCGMPFFASTFSGLDAIAGNDNDTDSFHPELTCFGDVLHKAGYTQVYIGGAPIEFSNKGLFYTLHGYNKALGLDQLESEYSGKLTQHGWGLYDSALFPVALDQYRRLESAGKPFNLTMITLDTHPPDGRLSPGCPRYAASANSMLQAVHCTDYLVGKFVDALSKQPGWEDTMVVIMSDHLMMRNVAEPLFPKSYHRQPAMIVLNAGKGVRPTRMYHMDIAPTLLDLMGVRTNATFIAGSNRSAPDAGDSKLVSNATTDAVLRKVLWSYRSKFQLCKNNILFSSERDDKLVIGGVPQDLSLNGNAVAGVYGGQSLLVFVDKNAAKLVVATPDRKDALLKTRGTTSVMIISPLTWANQGTDLFTVDWLGANGAWSHLANIPQLNGVTVASPQCGEVIKRADAAQVAQKLDLARDFSVEALPAAEMPASPTVVSMRDAASARFESGLGWLPPATWGSYTVGSDAGMAFRLPAELCDGAVLHMTLDPYLPPSRPKLETQVWANGRMVTVWHFAAPARVSNEEAVIVSGDDTASVEVSTPIKGDQRCSARLRLRFVRPGAKPGPYPEDENPMDLQLRILDMKLTNNVRAAD